MAASRQNNKATKPSAETRLSQQDINTMAILLESRHGSHAKDMANFFSGIHAKLGDEERCWAWDGVATMVEERARERGDDG